MLCIHTCTWQTTSHVLSVSTCKCLKLSLMGKLIVTTLELGKIYLSIQFSDCNFEVFGYDYFQITHATLTQ